MNMRTGLTAVMKTTQAKIGATAFVGLSAVATVGAIAAQASFNEVVQNDTTYSTGQIDIRFGDKSGAANERHTLDVGASGLVPGDTMQRVVNVHNVGNSPLASLNLATSAPTTSSNLDTDTTHGLQMVIDECSTPWTEAGPPYVYTCSGTTTAVQTIVPVIQPSVDLGAFALPIAEVGHYRVTLSLPSTAGVSMQNQTSTIRFAITGTQAGPGNK